MRSPVRLVATAHVHVDLVNVDVAHLLACARGVVAAGAAAGGRGPRVTEEAASSGHERALALGERRRLLLERADLGEVAGARNARERVVANQRVRPPVKGGAVVVELRVRPRVAHLIWGEEGVRGWKRAEGGGEARAHEEALQVDARCVGLGVLGRDVVGEVGDVVAAVGLSADPERGVCKLGELLEEAEEEGVEVRAGPRVPDGVVGLIVGVGEADSGGALHKEHVRHLRRARGAVGRRGGRGGGPDGSAARAAPCSRPTGSGTAWSRPSRDKTGQARSSAPRGRGEPPQWSSVARCRRRCRTRPPPMELHPGPPLSQSTSGALAALLSASARK